MNILCVLGFHKWMPDLPNPDYGTGRCGFALPIPTNREWQDCERCKLSRYVVYVPSDAQWYYGEAHLNTKHTSY